MELIIFISMISIFMLGAFILKMPISVSMALAAIGGALIGGYGIPVRHLVEGAFGYIDTILVIATAMIFMNVIQESGTLDALNSTIVKKYHKKPAILLILLMLIAMFPGMITGSSTASVLSAGAIVAPIFMMLGIPRVETGAIIAIAGILGMASPPVNIPAMIIGGGIDIPYVGFTIPLLLLTIPPAIFTVLFKGLKYVKEFDYTEIESKLYVDEELKGFKVYIPIIIVILLMVTNKVLPSLIPDLGMPLIFVIGSIVGMFTGKKVDIIKNAKNGVNTTLPLLGILVGVGMFIQIMTLTGVRGFIVINVLSLPSVLLFLSIIVAIPAFGAVSAYGSASVLGVPFLLSLLGKNEIIVTAALSLIVGVGDFVPPAALAGRFAAQVVGEKKYSKVLKASILPCAIILLWGLLFIIFAEPIASIIF